MKKEVNLEAYILGLELTVKGLSGRIKELEETLNKERASNAKRDEEMKKRVFSLEADIRRAEIEKGGAAK